jgi:hypothetical protein
MLAASLAISAASAVVQYQGQQAQYSADKQRYQQNLINSRAAQRDEQRSLTLRQMQEQDALSQKTHLVKVESAERQADVKVSAAGGNVSGISVDNLIGDVVSRAGTQQNSLERNWENTAAQLQAEQDATATRTQGRINQVAQPTAPSAAGPVLGFLGSGLKAYGTYAKET